MPRAESQQKIRQLAIVLTSMGRAPAQRILSSLPKDTALAIQRSIGQLGTVSASERDLAFETLRPILQAIGEPAAKRNRGGRDVTTQGEQSPAEQLLQSGYEQQDYADIRYTASEEDASLAKVDGRGTKAAKDHSGSNEDSLIEWNEASSQVWAELLQIERPILIATVLAHAPEHLASQILQELPTEVAVNTLAAMPKIGHTELEVYREIAGQLNSRLSSFRDRSPAGGWGLHRAKGILESLPPTIRSQWARQLESMDATLAVEFSDYIAEAPGEVQSDAPDLLPESVHAAFVIADPRSQIKIAEHTWRTESIQDTYSATASSSRGLPEKADSAVRAYDAEDFDSLLQLSKVNLARVIRACEPEVVLLALSGASRKWLARFEKLLDPRELDRFRAKLQSMSDRTLEDVDAAQSEVVQAAADLGLFAVDQSDLLAA